jgi:hypothetical protein
MLPLSGLSPSLEAARVLGKDIFIALAEGSNTPAWRTILSEYLWFQKKENYRCQLSRVEPDVGLNKVKQLKADRMLVCSTGS